MPGWASALSNYLYGLVYPQPDPEAAYGYRWQPRQGLPAALQILVPDQVAPGLYVAFTGGQLGEGIDPFGRGPGQPGPVFAAPGGIPPPLANLVGAVARNPPPGQGGWRNPVPGRLADIGGFLAYVAACLDLINGTGAGATLLTRLTTPRYPVFITPGLATNQTFVASEDDAVDTLTRAVRDYANGGPVPGPAINDAVQTQYGNAGGMPVKFNRLADDMNNAPLYSLFVDGAAFTPAYLSSTFRFQGQALSGQHLLNWCTPGGFPAFDATVRGMTAPGPDGVAVLHSFLLALCIALYAAAPRGSGSGAGVKFNVRNEGDNVQGSPDFRPPAVGLAHELMHAMHYGRGSAPGYPIGHYTTTAAELMFAGIGPSATEPVNENAVRTQWAPAVADPSNRWPGGPVQRRVYEPPPPGRTAAQMRSAYHCV